jgi:GTP-binding protein
VVDSPSATAPEDASDAEALEAGRLLFTQSCDFVAAAQEDGQIPDSALPEVAFAGRSNVGKSSLINALTGRKSLARTSRTPGRTRQLNFFSLAARLMLCDLPGYGYARASKGAIAHWTELTRRYLLGRPLLRRVCLLIDARHGLKESDRAVMAAFDRAAVTYQLVLTKCDKIGEAELARLCGALEAELAKRPAAHPRLLATSAVAGRGIAELRAELAALALAPDEAGGQFD